MNARLLALTGPACSGKTTTSLEFEARGFVRVRFAGPLKSMLRALGLTAEQVDGTLEQKSASCDLLCGNSPRHAMQALGTEWGRELIGPNVWVNAAMRLVDELLAAGRDVVIDDCRFDNEAHAVRARGGVVIELARNPPIDDSHASEAGVTHRLVSGFVSNRQRTPTETADRVETILNDSYRP